MSAEQRTRLRDFYSEKQCVEIITAFDECELVLSSKQMDWSEDISYRFGLYGMAAYCSAADKSFLDSQIARLSAERQMPGSTNPFKEPE